MPPEDQVIWQFAKAMAKKQKATKPVAKKITVVSKRAEKEKYMFLGGQRLLQRPADEKSRKEQGLLFAVAKVAGVSPMGINILGGNVYFNELGRKQQANKYGGEIRYEYKWIKDSIDDTDKAICECRIMKGNTPVTDWVRGECSPASMKMGTLKGYQNHMAQTRARNRAIWEAYGVKIHEDMLARLEWMFQSKEINEKEVSQIQGKVMSGTVEENVVEQNPIDPDKQTQAELGLIQLADEHGAEIGKEWPFIQRTIGRTLVSGTLTVGELAKIRTEFLSKIVKR